MKKVLIYSGHSEVVGGDVKYIVDLLNRLTGPDFDFSLYTDRGCHFEEWAKNWLKVPIIPHYLDTRPALFRMSPIETWIETRLPAALRRGARLAYRIISLQELRAALHNAKIFYRLIREKKPDVFWFNNGGYPGKAAGLVGCIAARRLGVPQVMMTFHNVPAPRRFYRVSELIFDFLVNRSVHRVVAVSKFLKTTLSERRGFAEDKVQVLYCGLEDRKPLPPEEAKSLRAALGIEEAAPIALIVGNLDPLRKGHEVLFEAFAEVVRRYPGAQLLVVGSGAEARVKALRSFAARLGIHENLHFLGQRYDIHELNSLSDVAVVPSLSFEATPYTIKEASRAGRPVITTNAGGCAEAVAPGESGILVPCGDSPRLAEALMSLFKNERLKEKMGGSSRAFFLEHFLIDPQIPKYIGFLRGDLRN